MMKSGRHTEAAKLLQATRLINPFNVERLLDLGAALLNCGQFKDALRSFSDVLDLDAANVAAMRGKAQCQLLEGEINEALTLMRQLSGPRELASIFNNAAVLAIRQGRFDQGTSLYKTAISALGRNQELVARLFFNLGIAHHKMSQNGEALENFQKALQFDPGFAKARHNVTQLATKLGRKLSTAPAATVKDNVSLDLQDDFADETV
jgi:Tfp pilus assembly protein PilF